MKIGDEDLIERAANAYAARERQACRPVPPVLRESSDIMRSDDGGALVLLNDDSGPVAVYKVKDDGQLEYLPGAHLQVETVTYEVDLAGPLKAFLVAESDAILQASGE